MNRAGVGVVIVIIAVAARFAIRTMGTKSIDEQLVTLSAEINKKLPRQIDEYTRFDKTTPGPHSITLFHTLSGVEESEFTDEAIQLLEAQVRANVKSSKEMEPFRKHKIKMICVYSMPNKKEVCRFEIIAGE